MARFCVAAICLLAMSACSAPDAGSGVKAFEETVAIASKSTKPQIDKAVAAQTRAAVAAAARSGRDIYAAPLGCQDVALSLDLSTVSEDQQVAPCALRPKVTLSKKRGDAKFAQEGLQTLQDYAATLSAISGSSVAGDVTTNFNAFNQSLSEFAATVNVAPKNAPLNAEQVGALGNLIGTVVEARRRAILERLVSTAHPEIRTIVYELIAHFEIKGGDNMLDAFDRLDAAYGRMTDAQGTSAYPSAVRSYEQEFERFEKAKEKAQSVKLLAIWRQHQLLLEQVKSRPDATEIGKLVKQVQALKG